MNQRGRQRAEHVNMRMLLVLAVVLLGVCPPGWALVDEHKRLDCAFIHSITKQECEHSGCVHEVPKLGIPRTPSCYLQPDKHGYSTAAVTKTQHGLEASLKLKPATSKIVQLKNPISELKLSVVELTSKIVRIKLTDPHHARYEVPITEKHFNIPKPMAGAAKEYEVGLTKGDHFDLVVKRKATGAKLIDTSIGPMLFADKFLQFATHLATDRLYGMGENMHYRLQHNPNYTTLPMMALDMPPGNAGGHYYSVHPFYMIVENDGKAHGVFLLNSNAMAYTTLPAPGISLKTTGGVLDLFVFVGDSPAEVIQLYTSIIGRPVMPPFWGLGFQLCRYGYKDLNDVKQVVKRNFDHKVPIDVLYLDIDYMDQRRDFTYDHHLFANLSEYVNETKAEKNVRWTFIVDPAIEGGVKGYRAFDEGYKKDVFIKWPASVPVRDRKNPEHVPNDKNVFYGHVWPNGPVAFPDFFKNATRTWWIETFEEFHKEINFDAIWIDMNEPSNNKKENCPDGEYSVSFPNLGLKHLSEKTICMCSRQGEHGEFAHYDVHNLYGWSETEPTQAGVHAATGKRGFVVSRSTYPSSGRYGAHWLGDQFATWSQLGQSIIGIIEFNMFGINFVGSDICGFIGQTHPELCRRWYQLGAYYPFSRSHNDKNFKPQDPAYFIEIGHPEVTQSMIQAYEVRYQLLHYYYTLFYRAHVMGETLIRAVGHEFPTIAEAATIDNQFLIGSSILVSPFLKEKQTQVIAYVPPAARWFYFADNFVAPVTNKTHTFHDADSHRPLLLREGLVLPLVTDLPKPLNTHEQRRKPMELWVMPTDKGEARGDLFWDDGDSIDTIGRGEYNYFDFHLANCRLTIKPVHHGLDKGNDGEVTKISAVNIALNKSVKLDKLEVTVDGHKVVGTVILSHLSIPLGDLVDLFKTNKSIDIVFSSNSKCFLP